MQSNERDVIRATMPDKRQTKISRIRELFHALEEAKQNGVSHVALVAALEKIGIGVTVKSLSRMLVQIRRAERIGVISTKQKNRTKTVPLTPSPSASTEPAAKVNPLTGREKGQQMADMYITPRNHLLTNLMPTKNSN